MKSLRFVSAASIAAIALGCSVPALAAETAAAADPGAVADGADGDGLAVIVVTAEKRTTNLQETPIAISVMGTDDLANRHVTSLLDLGDGAIPSLRVAPFFSRQSALIMNVRGIGVMSDSNQPARDQGVGVYVDGVYLGRAQGLGTAIFDVDSIEVLKGPQGTLFGRNTEGGAVNITTKKPSGEFKLGATVGMGNFGTYKGDLHLDLPRIGNLAVKVDGTISHRDPLVKNPLAGFSGFGAYDKRGLHLEALWKPVDGFTADYSFDTSYDATTSLYMQQVEAPAGLPATATSAAIAPFILAAATPVQPNRVSVAAVGAPQQPSVGKTHGHRLNLEWQAAEGLTLKSITSYRELTQSQYDNGSLAASFNNSSTGVFTGQRFGRYSLAKFRQNQVSEELQAVGETGRVKFAFGGLFYQEKVEDNAQAPFTAQFTNASGSTYTILSVDTDNTAQAPIQRASHVTTTSLGAYGQATYTPALLDEALHLTAGARYSHDKKVGALFMVNNALPVLPVNGVDVTGPIALDSTWSRVDPMVNLAFDASRDVHLYGKWSTGFRSGGANSRSLSYKKFDPETVSMFELGAKTEFWDHKARFNVAAYAGTYKGIQLDFFGLYEDFVNGQPVVTTRTTSDTINAPGTGKVKGIEAELTLAPVRGLTLSASYAYNSVKIPDTLNPFRQPNGTNPSFLITTPIPIYQVYTPENSASGSIDYEAPMNGFTLKAHLDANYDSGFYGSYTDVTYDAVTRAVRYAQPKGDKSLVVNGRIALADIEMANAGAKVTIAAWARNLLNEQHLFYKSGSPTGGVSGFFNDPRTFGIELGIKM